MRHRKKGRQLGRTTKHRWALYRSLVTSLLDQERIETTEAKAKAIRGLAERMITLGKRGGLHNRRRALGFIRSKTVVSKVFEDMAERFRGRPGGYTRIIRTRRRVGDAAAMVAIELVTRPGSAATGKSKQAEADKSAKPSAGAGS